MKLPISTRLALVCISIGVFLMGLAMASNALAHGPHASYIQPAYDCYPERRGDIYVTHDTDLNRYIRWQCTCKLNEVTGKLYCWWRIVWIVKSLSSDRAIIPSNTRLYYPASICKRWVKWAAWHDGNQVVHLGRRYVIHVRHR